VSGPTFEFHRAARTDDEAEPVAAGLQLDQVDHLSVTPVEAFGYA
jgi:hypothetical protein